MSETKQKLPSFRWQSPIGMASFVHLESPDTEGQYADNKYKLDVIFEASQALADFEEKAIKMATEYFGKIAGCHLPVKTGNDKDTSKYTTYKDKLYITAKSTRQPTVLGVDNKPIEADKIYSGAFIRVIVTAALFKTGATKGVTCYLEAVQFVKDGKRLDEGKSSVVAFTDEASEVAAFLADA